MFGCSSASVAHPNHTSLISRPTANDATAEPSAISGSALPQKTSCANAPNRMDMTPSTASPWTPRSHCIAHLLWPLRGPAVEWPRAVR